MAGGAEIRVEIGFEGGLIVSMRLDEEQWAKLDGALATAAGGGGSLVSVEGEGGVAYHVDPRRVCYVRRERQAARIGF
jgi:hypothetical protein